MEGEIRAALMRAPSSYVPGPSIPAHQECAGELELRVDWCQRSEPVYAVEVHPLAPPSMSSLKNTVEAVLNDLSILRVASGMAENAVLAPPVGTPLLWRYSRSCRAASILRT